MPFKLADALEEKKKIVAVYGRAKDGKTTFALSFPEPLYVLNFDYGFAELVAGFPDKKIYHVDYSLPDEYEYGAYKVVEKQFIKDWREACTAAGKDGGTVILDTGDNAWDLVRLVELEEAKNERISKFGDKADRDDRRDYGKPNLTFENLLKRPYQFGCNAVFIQRASPVFRNSEATGQYVMHGFNATANVAQIVLNVVNETVNVVDKLGKSVNENGHIKTANRIVGIIESCRFSGGLALRGQRIENPTYDSLVAFL